MKWDNFNSSYWLWPSKLTPDILENILNIEMRNCRIGKITMKEKLP